MKKPLVREVQKLLGHKLDSQDQIIKFCAHRAQRPYDMKMQQVPLIFWLKDPWYQKVTLLSKPTYINVTRLQFRFRVLK